MQGIGNKPLCGSIFTLVDILPYKLSERRLSRASYEFKDNRKVVIKIRT